MTRSAKYGGNRRSTLVTSVPPLAVGARANVAEMANRLRSEACRPKRWTSTSDVALSTNAPLAVTAVLVRALSAGLSRSKASSGSAVVVVGTVVLVGDAVIGDAEVGDWVVGEAEVGDCVVGEADVGDRVAGEADVGDMELGGRVVGDWVVGDCVVGDSVVGDADVADAVVGSAVVVVVTTVVVVATLVGLTLVADVVVSTVVGTVLVDVAAVVVVGSGTVVVRNGEPQRPVSRAASSCTCSCPLRHKSCDATCQ